MNCECHGEPMYRWWNRDLRWPAGGYWRNQCAIKERQRQRDRYDNDPIWRIEKNLKNDALKRRQTIERRRAHGSVPE